MSDRHSEDLRMESAMGELLRIGVTVSALVVLAGGLLYLHQIHGPMQDYHTFRPEAENLRKPAQIVAGALRGDSRSIIELGLLLLVATPIARVVFAVAGFIKEKDKLYATVSAAVLAVLLYSVIFGR